MCLVEFQNAKKANKAFKNLQHTILYGKKIGIEWSE